MGNLKEKFERTAKSMTQLMLSLKLQAEAFPRFKGFPEEACVYDTLSISSSSPKSRVPSRRKLSVHATEFNPSNYATSTDSDSGSNGSIEIILSSSDSERILVPYKGRGKHSVINYHPGQRKRGGREKGKKKPRHNSNPPKFNKTKKRRTRFKKKRGSSRPAQV